VGLNIFELLYIFTPINSSLRLSGNGHLGYLGCLENIKMKTSKIGSAPRHLSDCKLVQKIWCIWLLSFPINLVRNIFAFNEIFRFFGNQEQDLKPEKNLIEHAGHSSKNVSNFMMKMEDHMKQFCW